MNGIKIPALSVVNSVPLTTNSSANLEISISVLPIFSHEFS